MAGARSTKASAAVERLKQRSGNPDYSMGRTGDGLFYLVAVGAGGSERLCQPLEIDAFVEFVNGLGPQKAQKVSRHDAAFERQLGKKKS